MVFPIDSRELKTSFYWIRMVIESNTKTPLLTSNWIKVALNKDKKVIKHIPFNWNTPYLKQSLAKPRIKTQSSGQKARLALSYHGALTTGQECAVSLVTTPVSASHAESLNKSLEQWTVSTGPRTRAHTHNFRSG